eukprot:6187353-Pleurochrysis_carterae.AAC.1
MAARRRILCASVSAQPRTAGTTSSARETAGDAASAKWRDECDSTSCVHSDVSFENTTCTHTRARSPTSSR